MAVNLVQSATYLTNLMQIYMQTANTIFSTSSLHLLYQHRQLQQTVRSLSGDASKTLVQAFVSCLLDYCNHLFLASRKDWWTGCSRRPSGYLNSSNSMFITSLLSQLHCYRYASASTSMLRLSCFGRCQAFNHHRTVPSRRLPSIADARERRLRSTASQTCVVTQTYSTFSDKAFCSCWTPTMEQSSIAPDRDGLIVQ